MVVKVLADQHLPKAQARELYEDVPPPPSPEEQAVADILRAGRLGDDAQRARQARAPRGAAASAVWTDRIAGFAGAFGRATACRQNWRQIIYFL